MDAQPMLTRDLVLRVCANSTEFDEAWMAAERKAVVPFLAPRDTTLVDAAAAAAAAVGVDRVLICRTRAEFAYEPVTDAPATTAGIVDVIRGWGDDPTDVLIVVEDLSAAVLITAEELTVAAGPADFASVFTGSDLPGARAEFGAEARRRRDPELLRAAQRYGCTAPGARHARTTRGPGPDTAERLAERAHRLRTGSPRAAAALRAVRGGACWLLLAAFLVSLLFVPDIGGSVPVLLGTVWLLTQLALFARSRTVGFATLLRVAVLGAALAWPLAFAEQTLAAPFGRDGDWIGPTYIAVPVEELGKLLPLLLLWVFARRRLRRSGAVDLLLLGAASGAGFQAAEQVLLATAGGPFAAVADYGPFTLVPGASVAAADGTVFAGHAVTTGLIAGAVGFALVGRHAYRPWVWLGVPLAAGLAFLDHLHYNAALLGLPMDPVSSTIAVLTGNGALARWLLLGLLVAAVLLDLRLMRLTGATTPPLPGAAPLAGLRAAASGRGVRARVRVPGDIAPSFRRIALAWIRLPRTLADGLSTVLHEFAVQLRAARRGPSGLFDAWRYLRARRSDALGAVRAPEGRPWRRYPPPERLDAARRALEPGGAAAGAAVIAAAAFAVVHPAAVPALGSGAAAGAAYVLSALQAAMEWFDGLPADGRIWAAVAGTAAAVLLASGWAAPADPPAMGVLLRRPGPTGLALLGAAAPGQLPYWAAALVARGLGAALHSALRPSPPGPFAPPDPAPADRLDGD
ncbi:PrsW family intramembrane metalloprotease [Nocardiopsis coralliicola]